MTHPASDLLQRDYYVLTSSKRLGVPDGQFFRKSTLQQRVRWRRQQDSNPRPADYKSRGPTLLRFLGLLCGTAKLWQVCSFHVMFFTRFHWSLGAPRRPGGDRLSLGE